MKNLEKCIENPAELANLFKKYDRKFQMYTRYCQNKPKSEYIVSEYVETYIEVNSPYIFLTSSSSKFNQRNIEHFLPFLTARTLNGSNKFSLTALPPIFQEIRLKLGFRLRLPDILIEPVQRLTKYHLLLETLVKLSIRAGLNDEADVLSKAHRAMKLVADQCNDMMDIGEL